MNQKKHILVEQTKFGPPDSRFNVYQKVVTIWSDTHVTEEKSLLGKYSNVAVYTSSAHRSYHIEYQPKQ